MKRYIYILFVLLLISSIIYADEGRKGQAGFQFLRIPMGAKQIAMGNSGIASVTGANAMYWNPAGVATQKNLEFQFSNVSWFGDVSYTHFTGVAGLGEIGTIGLGIQYLAYPEMIETTELSPDGTGATFKPYDFGLVLNFSRQLTEQVSFGLNVKYVSETIALVSADAYAFDAGLIYSMGYQGLKLGFAISNYGSAGQFSGSGLRRFMNRQDGPPDQTPVPMLFEADKIEMPSSVQGGLSFSPITSDIISIIINADYTVNTFSANRTNIGSEWGYKDIVFLRAGYVVNSDYNKTNKGNFNFGAGIQYELMQNFKVVFDYAYADLGLLDNAQYITIGIQF
jgi:opacity protein-like surface antigen